MSQETLDIHLARAVAGNMLQIRLAAKRGDSEEVYRRLVALNNEIVEYVKKTTGDPPNEINTD